MKVFGKNPAGERLERISQSGNFRNGSFQNLNETPMLVKGVSYTKMLREYYNRQAHTAPPIALPSVQTNLKELNHSQPVFVWFGHSSYLIRIAGLNILVDPVFSGNASPFRFFGKAFPGSNPYGVDDMPDIDILVLTHDHFDHMDYSTVTKLHPKVKFIITSLGAGAHLEYWGIPGEKIAELDWWEKFELPGAVTITATPARHFSGRTFTRNKTLWSSFVLRAGSYSIYLGGDSGYDDHFKSIGRQYGPFELAILECGQYGKNWPYIHMFPEQTVDAARDLGASLLIPVHWGKFVLSVHAWNEPVKKVFTIAGEKALPIATPRIGELFVLGEEIKPDPWWEI